MSSIQLTSEWVNDTFKPSLASYLCIQVALNKLVKDSDIPESKVFVKKALMLPLLGLNSIFDILHLQLRQSQFIGGSEPNVVDQEAYIALDDVLSKGVIKLNDYELIDRWYNLCKHQFG